MVFPSRSTRILLVSAAAAALLPLACGSAPRPAASPTASPNPAKSVVAWVLNSTSPGSMTGFAADGTRVSQVATPEAESAIASGPEGVFVLGKTGVARYDVLGKRFGTPVSLTGVSASPEAMTVGGGSVWVLASDAAKVYRLNPKTLETTGTADTGSQPHAIVFAGNSAWIANASGASVSIIDNATGAAKEDKISCRAEAIAAATNSVWALCDRGIVEYDVSTKARKGVNFTRPGGVHNTMLVAANALWITETGANGAKGQLVKAQFGTGSVEQTVTVGANPYTARVVGKEIWVANFGDNTVSRVDPTAGSVTGTFDSGSRPSGIAPAQV